MILDAGIADFQRQKNIAPPGGKPEYAYSSYYSSYYAELNFETSPAYPTADREEVRTDARIRVLQNRSISNHDRVVLFANGTEKAYEVTRAYHGEDPDSGEMITDVTLEEIKP